MAEDDHFIKDSISEAQEFGGPWSLIKTEMVELYVRFFNTALSRKPFERIYIDAFAGSGSFKFPRPSERMLFAEMEAQPEVHAGSARRALQSQPPFHRLYFIEQNPVNAAALRELVAQSQHPASMVLEGEANSILRGICRSQDWKLRRGVVFLDPFGMNVEWVTLAAIAETRALDVWFLFALAGTVRNLPRMASRLDPGKRAAVTRVLGTHHWFDEFYGEVLDPRMPELGIAERPRVLRRIATVDQIEDYVRRRLASIFAHVEPPRRLMAPGRKLLFSLFFAVSNTDEAAITLAQRGARHILERS